MHAPLATQHEWLAAVLRALPPANSTHHSHMGAGADMTRVTLGKSRVRESRLTGSVRAKPNH